ncbi:MAG: hypothetical protein HYY41_03525 [Chloroflexi bacterium]|nr:hypothetical protein [Chloroflexota bacterium]
MVVCIVGLGYVGLPLAEAFARSTSVIGFDIDVKIESGCRTAVGGLKVRCSTN